MLNEDGKALRVQGLHDWWDWHGIERQRVCQRLRLFRGIFKICCLQLGHFPASGFPWAEGEPGPEHSGDAAVRAGEVEGHTHPVLPSPPALVVTFRR